MVEMLVASIIAAFAIYTIYSKFKNKASVGCGCGGCGESKGKIKK
ncbi:MAG: FeoB-associated Cys-rich membrane protein [Clostridium lundense]|nr:FeoB-associated Cys-rich membrane protein [Clostridium lundense]